MMPQPSSGVPRRSTRIANLEAGADIMVSKTDPKVKTDKVKVDKVKADKSLKTSLKRRTKDEGEKWGKKKKYSISERFKPLHSTFWKMPLPPMLLQTVVDSNTFDYLPKDILDDLNLNLLNFPEALLLFREEYRTALDTLKSWKKPPVKGVVVTGYPGIGKTYFLLFVLLQRLSEGLPTAVQFDEDTFILFTDQGPTDHLGIGGSYLPMGTWALSDSNTGSGEPCIAFQRSRADVFVVQTTSPKASRYKEWRKQRRGVRMFVMECITAAELKALSQLYSLDVDQLVKYYNDWGPSARTCLDLAEGNPSVGTLEKNAFRAALKFATTMKTPVLDEYDPADVSNMLFSIHPVDSSRENMSAMIATDHILDIVLAQVSWLDAAQQSLFFNMISGHPWLKSPLGNFYEKLLHVRLTADRAVEPLLCTLENGSPPSIPVVPNVVSVSGSSNLGEANQNALPVYWRPVSQTFTSFDAIICTSTMIFLIQITVSPRHSIKIKGLKFIRDNIPSQFWKERQCYIIFVTPDQDRAARLSSRTYPALEDFPEVKVCSCVFPIGTSTFTSSQLNELRKLSVQASEDDMDDDLDAEDELSVQ